MISSEKSRLIEISAFLLLFILLFIIFSRGLFEFLTGSKQAAFLVQFISTLAVLIFSAVISGFSIKNIKGAFFYFFISFTAVVVVSSIITLVRFGFVYEIAFYSAVMLYLFFIFSFFSMVSSREIIWIDRIAYSVLITGIILLAFALFETSIELTKFPGEAMSLGLHGNLYRPASFTGSYLHFPIIMPLFGAIVLRFIRQKRLKIFGLIFLIVPFLYFSRSGMVISVFALIGFLSATLFKTIRNKANLKIIIPSLSAILIAAIIILFIHPLRSYIVSMIDRVLIINDKGNLTRYSIWSSAFLAFSKTHYFFGEYTGFSSNIINNFFNNGSMRIPSSVGGLVLESGFLELLVSYGLLGTIIYYGGMILAIASNIKRGEMLLSLTMAGAVIQTLFYQSVEILPFIFCFSIIQFMANSSAKIQVERKNA